MSSISIRRDIGRSTLAQRARPSQPLADCPMSRRTGAPGQRRDHASGASRQRSTGGGRCPAAMSARGDLLQDGRRAARVATHTPWSPAAAPRVVDQLGRRAVHVGQRSLDGPDDVGHGDSAEAARPASSHPRRPAGWRPGRPVGGRRGCSPGTWPGCAGAREHVALDRARGCRRQLGRGSHRVIDLGRDAHVVLPTARRRPLPGHKSPRRCNRPGSVVDTTLLRPAGLRRGRHVPHPDLDAEQAYLDHAYRCLAAMRDRTARAAAIAESAAQAVDSAIAQAHLAHRLGSLDADVPGARASAASTSEGGDTLVRRPPPRRGRPRRPGGGRLAGRRGHAVLPGDRRRPPRPAAPAAVHDDRPPARRPVRRGVRRPRQRRRRPPRRHPRPAAGRAGAGAHRRDARHRRHDRRPSRTWSSGRRSTPAWSCRAAPAPARRRSVCTGPPSCSTSTAASSTPRACWWSAPTRCSCATSPRCCPRSGETAVRQTTLERLLAGTAYRVRGRRRRRRRPAQGRRPHGGGARPRAVASASGRPTTTWRCATTWGTVRVGRRRRGDRGGRGRRPRACPHNVGRAALPRTRLLRLVRAELVRRRGDEAGRRRGRWTPTCAPTATGAGRWTGCGPPLGAAGPGPPAAHQPGGAGGRGRRLLDRDEQAAMLPAADPPGGRRAVDGGRPGAARRGRGAGRRPAPRLRPHRRRRGPGPVGHGAAGAGPPLPGRVDDRARRPGPGHGPGGPAVVGRGASPTWAPRRPPGGPSSTSATGCRRRSWTWPTGCWPRPRPT